MKNRIIMTLLPRIRSIFIDCLPEIEIPKDSIPTCTREKRKVFLNRCIYSVAGRISQGKQHRKDDEQGSNPSCLTAVTRTVGSES